MLGVMLVLIPFSAFKQSRMNEHIAGQVHARRETLVPGYRSHTVHDLAKDEIGHHTAGLHIAILLTLFQVCVQALGPESVIVVIGYHAE